MRITLRRVALAAPIAAAGVILGLTIPSLSLNGSSNVLRPRPETALAQAQRLTGFSLALPSWLPPGATLDRVSWPDNFVDGVRVVKAVDVWYRLGNGVRLHVWQTKDTALEKSPAGMTDALMLSGRRWWRDRTRLGTSLTTRLPNGVTVQITAPLSDAVVERIANSIAS